MNEVNELVQKINTAKKAMLLARQVSLEWFHKSVPTAMKVDKTPVTLADKKIEELIHNLILDRWPETSFLGEETGLTKGINDNCVWLLDPIDGTKNFMAGSPLFGTLLAYLENGIPVFGMVLMPILDQLWIGVDTDSDNKGTRCNGKTILIKKNTSLSQSMLSMTSPDMFIDKDKALIRKIKKNIRFCNYGGDCFNYLSLARGRTDIIIEADLKAVDIIPLIPIIKQAGGMITGWNNEDIVLTSFKKKYKILATTSKKLHKEVLDILAN